MITLPDTDMLFLLVLQKKYGLSTVTVSPDAEVFSKELQDKVSTEGEEMEAYYNHLHLMELWAELEYEATKCGPFRILISNGKLFTEKI